MLAVYIILQEDFSIWIWFVHILSSRRDMYILKTEQSFDSAHFLSGYEGKCANIHGHRWRVIIEVKTEQLAKDQRSEERRVGKEGG